MANPLPTLPRSSATPEIFRAALSPAEENIPAETEYIHRFKDVSIRDAPLVGDKNASLGEMFRELAEACRYFLRSAQLDEKIRVLLLGLDTRDIENLRDVILRLSDLKTNEYANLIGGKANDVAFRRLRV